MNKYKVGDILRYDGRYDITITKITEKSYFYTYITLYPEFRESHEISKELSHSIERFEAEKNMSVSLKSILKRL